MAAKDWSWANLVGLFCFPLTCRPKEIAPLDTRTTLTPLVRVKTTHEMDAHSCTVLHTNKSGIVIHQELRSGFSPGSIVESNDQEMLETHDLTELCDICGSEQVYAACPVADCTLACCTNCLDANCRTIESEWNKLHGRRWRVGNKTATPPSEHNAQMPWIMR